jgi:hypothetical protein
MLSKPKSCLKERSYSTGVKKEITPARFNFNFLITLTIENLPFSINFLQKIRYFIFMRILIYKFNKFFFFSNFKNHKIKKNICICTSVYVFSYIYVYTYVHICIYICTHIHICRDICTYIYIHRFIYIHICTHTLHIYICM